jgi:hypothetical protein
MLEDIGQWIGDVMGSLDYVGLALLLVLENLFPPIPSEVVLPLAGFFVGMGDFTFSAAADRVPAWQSSFGEPRSFTLSASPSAGGDRTARPTGGGAA